MTGSHLQPITPKLQLKYFKPIESGIDVILLSPVSDNTVASVQKFASWVRNIHVQNGKDPSCIGFKQELVHYSICSPNLSEHIIVIQPGFLFTDYVFASQFFIGSNPVIRKPLVGVSSLTRKLLNENSFYEHTACPVMFGIKNGIKSKRILFKDNSLKCVQHEKDVSYDNQVIAKPHKSVIIVVDNYAHTIDAIGATWVILTTAKPDYSVQKLKFYQRVSSLNGTIVEVVKQPNLEKLAVAAVRSVTLRHPDTIYGPTAGIPNAIANKMALVYETSFQLLD